MKRYILILLVFQISHSQTNLDLPISDYEIDYKYLTPISSIYVYDNGEIYLEKEIVKISELGKILFKTKSQFPFENQNSIQVHLLADKSTDFKVIDSIKTQISSARLNLYYRTNDIDDITKGINWRNHSSLNYIELPEENSTNDENDIIIDLDFIITPIEIQINEDLYNQNFDNVENILNSIKYANIRYLDNNYIKINSTEVKIKDQSKILEIISDFDVLFIRFQNKMTYNEYIETITTFKDVYRKLKAKKNREIPIFEISYDLETVMNKNNFKL